MSRTVTVPCWRLYIWRGHWLMRSVHDSLESAQAEAVTLQLADPHVRLRVGQSTRRIAVMEEAPAPTEAQRFREQQADRMVIRRQALAYYKSGSNGTELPQLPPEA